MTFFATLLCRFAGVRWGRVCALLALSLPQLSLGQTTIVNYDFNNLATTIAYPVGPAATAPGITSSATGSQTFAKVAGTATGAGAYTANPTDGEALNITNSGGTGKYFEFTLGGSSLPKYSAFKIYLQGYRPTSGATTLTLQYRVNSGALIPFGPTYNLATATVFSEGGFDLSGLPELNGPGSLTLRLLASGASGTGGLRIDNFQVQAVNTVDPLISSLAPGTMEAGSPDFALLVTGSSFRSGAVVSFNGQDLPTTYNSSTSLTAAVPADLVAAAGSYPVTVTNPPAAAGSVVASPPAPAVNFVVTPAVPHWTGRAGTSSWFAPANWSTGAVPVATDDVLLDHRFVAGSYTVSLDQDKPVSLKSLTVNPGVGDSIFALVPASNTMNPPLTLGSSTGTAMVTLAVYDRGVLTNASGASSGSGINIASSNTTVFLYNGGSYRHTSRTGHAGVAGNLSTVAGTELGIFDFRPPAGTNASATLSASGRSYGTLILRARPGAGGTFSYAGSGTTLTVRGNLLVGPGVTFTTTLSNDLRLAGDLRSQGTLQVKASTSPVSLVSQLLLAGSQPQTLSGAILLSPTVGLALNNPAGATLAAPLPLAGPLTLTSGALNTSAANLLTLSSTATVVGGSSTSFINGPLARQTADGAVTDLVFPTGSGTAYRPVMLNATTQTGTTYVVTQKEGPAANRNTLLASSAALPALTRVSKVRSYTITPLAANNFSGTITLSFGADDQVNAPDNEDLVAGKNSGPGWENIGRSSVAVTTPAPTGGYASGTITSGTFTSFSDFALARTTTDPAINPLPVSLSAFAARREAAGVRVTWTTAAERNSHHFEVQRSLDGRTFAAIAAVAGHGTTAQQHQYAALDPAAAAQQLCYRLAQVDNDGQTSFSVVVVLAGAPAAGAVAQLVPYPNPAHERLTVPAPAATLVQVLDLTGRVLLTNSLPPSGELTLAGLSAGTYLLRTAEGRVWRFSKE